MTCPDAPSGTTTPLQDLPFDTDERQVLRIARMFFRTFAEPQSQSWIGGVGAALDGFDHFAAPHVYVATLGAVQSMRQSRRSTFRFNDPCCPACAGSVTDCERLFLGGLRAMRDDAPDRAAALACILCEGNEAGPWLVALGKLAAQLPPRVSADRMSALHAAQNALR
ncbi:hypothetical protein [Jannaschia sp. 2305UL9-9]|uniref:hypothetical protein n=1 Tax=Jannaschia sp. 2305UL9-9 TaxID=3121638 RepID=UPI00352782D5